MEEFMNSLAYLGNLSQKEAFIDVNNQAVMTPLACPGNGNGTTGTR